MLKEAEDSRFTVRELFRLPNKTYMQQYTVGYDIAPDGRFLMLISTEETPPSRILVETDFFEELKQKVPTGN